MNYTIKEIADITHSKFFGNGKTKIKNIAFDSRTIYSAKQTAFLAISTQKNSGQKYIDKVIEKGINTIITENEITNAFVNQIITKNSIEFLQTLARYHFEHSDINSIGITGSNGKTILKEWLYQCLWNEFATVKSPKSFNSQIGLPLSVLQIEKKHELGIFEVGISKPGEMEKQERVFQPKIGLLTHIGSAHSANFSSEEELIREKLKLFQHSEIIFYNGDNLLTESIIRELYPHKNLISYGLESSNRITIISEISNRAEDIQIQYFDEIISLPIFQRDDATLTNVLALVGILKELGISNSDIKEKIDDLKAVEMRLESVEGVRNNLIINDSYNLDLDSLKIAFQFIREYNNPRKSLILTDILDSGENRTALYHEVAELVNEQKFDKIFLIGDEIGSFSALFSPAPSVFSTTSQLIENKALNEIENQIVLLKGARKFKIERIKELLELRKHDTVLEINLNAILHNINFHKSLLKPETKMMAMVKANAYGLGSYEISEFLQLHHIDYLGVAFADEGIELRKKGITTPIIVMNPEQHSYDSIIEYNLEPEIYSLRVLEVFNEQLLKSGNQQKYPIHVKLETGMHRLGFKDFELDELIDRLRVTNVQVTSIFSHLSSADIPEERDFTLQQLKTFDKNSTYLINKLGYKPLRHILNSSGITNYTDYQYDMVRIGIGMIGESSNKLIKNQLQNSVCFKTVVSQISEVKSGESVGYGRGYRTDQDTKIATIPVGYADGIPRMVGNMVGRVGIHKKLYPIVGNVCMDMMMIRVDGANVEEGDPVVLFNSNPTLGEFSNYCKTIAYEVLTSISPRVKRIYIKN
ncbi:bifunctional UDP-N-acetylmuramoyl-tripeptide:D-alanyl-D-alanine ligase/alanine racemase [Chryseobacterium sp. SC28]|uniref:bifunctional UDP-N-acetylmuramoyl-tripeptide:D-alanyl-D-alanine ligase/alanine racemase n=1 Tax=Chryseobacterium sp. SC28 TaxID=2268028 RepID=UPI000F647296|nr:bifunctional UDP-N-acetylmuramoyl-tripeptide:D-alanyl-D-alanine ligase/alanine racemase [Chryseobacterium sp. SC28]RRQ46963.1 bifunctional UDP-N-acetylmuramoyl-tripeptide:D-alanyl-D-alanine ligase/alanine racemase [Chryseobacterium sp. SC28]